MAKIVLTRFLYIFDEVCITFLTCLLKKNDVNECYFWLSELYLSGYVKQCWEFIWFIYYDFYYIKNPQFEKFILKKQNTASLISIMTVVKNMFKMESSSHVFITRQYNANNKEINHIFRGKKPNWLQNISTKFHGLFRFIDKKLYHYAVSSLPIIDINNYDETLQITNNLFDNLQIYMNETCKNNITNEILNDVKENIYHDNYSNYTHKLWAKICLFIFNPNFHNDKKKLYVSCLQDEHNKMINIHEEDIPLSKHGNKQIYKTLVYKRLHSISPLCSSFKLERYNMVEYNENISTYKENVNRECINCFWYHWEYYAYVTPLWKDRFDKYDITIDTNNKKITFNNDDDCEDFYDSYGYEPDEQSCETVNKHITNMDYTNWKKWYESIFDEPPIYEFNDNYQFTY